MPDNYPDNNNPLNNNSSELSEQLRKLRKQAENDTTPDTPQGSDLTQQAQIPSQAQADSSELDDPIKEKYVRRVNEVLDTPLTPENFTSYADDAIDQIINVIEDMFKNFTPKRYPSEVLSLPYPKGDAEKYLVRRYLAEQGLDVGLILDRLVEK